VKMHERYKPVARIARAKGWTITITGGGHLRWQAPDGQFIFTPATPSSYRGVKKDLTRLRRAGLTAA
jgi:hypothetical protein